MQAFFQKKWKKVLRQGKLEEQDTIKNIRHAMSLINDSGKMMDLIDPMGQMDILRCRKK